MSRSVTIEIIVDALKELGGKARAKDIKDRVTEKMGGIPPHYSSSHSYRETIQRLIEDYCPESANYVGIPKFRRLYRGLYELIDFKKTIIIGEPLPKLQETKKYGIGGESQRHKILKQYIANNPSIINLPADNKVIIERSFPTGDRVDILMKDGDTNLSVIEIELEGEENLIKGAKQLIKYRVLELVENNFPLDSQICRAILVAYEINSKRLEAFCNKYNIEFYQVNPK